MRALVLQHVPVEGPGTLASYLKARGWTLETAALYKPRHGILYASASLRRLAFLRWKGL